MRAAVIAALICVEAAVLGGMVVSFRGSIPSIWTAVPTVTAAPDNQTQPEGNALPEGGAHAIFAAGSHPAVTVNIGYADLTVVTQNASQIDVGLSKSSGGFFFSSGGAPITARSSSGMVVVELTDHPGFSMGDDRMVTLVVPPETHVTVVNAGDIKATGLRAPAAFNSNGSGDVELNDFDAPALNITANHGDVTFHDVATARIDVSTSNGRVEGSGLQLQNGSISTSNGRVTLGFASGSNTVVNAQTSNGTIHLSGLTGTAAVAAPRKHKSSDDDDENDDDDDDNSDSLTAKTVRIGAGGGHLDVNTSNGNIRLTQDG